MGEILTGLLLTNLYYLKIDNKSIGSYNQIIAGFFLNIIVVYIYPKE